MLKSIKLFLVILLFFNIIFIFPNNRILAQDALIKVKVNVALNATATSNDKETDYWDADKVVDGIINRQETNKVAQSRWATNAGSDAKILTLNLGASKSFDEFFIAWERNNIKGFRIEISQDNQTYELAFEKKDDTYVELDTKIKLAKPLSARYVRLTVDKYDGGELNWASVSIYEFQVIANMELENLAFNKTIKSNGNEADKFGANLANDGSLDTRWASTRGHNQKTLEIDLARVNEVGSVVIEWERKNVQDYKILVSEDGSKWTVAKHLTRPSDDFRELINFDRKYRAKHIKLEINAFNSRASTRTSDTIIDWDTVSVLEIEAYQERIIPEKKLSLAEVARSLEVPAISRDTKKWSLPEVASPYSVSFIGADIEQIIDHDLNIHQPLVDTTVNVNYKVSKGQESVETQAISVEVPGLYQIEEGDNQKPIVVPAIAEWKGKRGFYTIQDSTRIVVNPKDKDKLGYAVQNFKKIIKN